MSTVILGLDPGSQVTGYGLVELRGAETRYLESGVLKAPRETFLKRLAILSDEICELLNQFRPDMCVVERIFLGKSPDSAFKLGHIRGICLSEALRWTPNIFEYSPRQVKKGITGYGHSGKEEVQSVLMRVLGLQGALPLDASDALALAYHHARIAGVQRQIAQQKEKTL